MKRITSLVLVIAFTAVILLPVGVNVNNRYSENVTTADGGAPIPPPIPCAYGDSPASLVQAS